MQALRILPWIIATAITVGLIVLNPQEVFVTVWPRAGAPSLGLDSGVGVIILASYLLGFVPMWLIARAAKWRYQRRIATLENSVAANSVVAPVASSTQLEAAAPPPPPPSPEPTL